MSESASDSQSDSARTGIVAVSLLGLCPRCGAKGLFAGVASFAHRCVGCGLDYDSFNVGDGPAAFLTFIVGGLAAVVAAWLALSVDPPVWVYVAVLVPLVVVPTLYGLRVSKAALLAAEFKRRAVEAGAKDVRGRAGHDDTGGDATGA